MAPTPTNRSVDRSLRASCSIQAAHRQMRWQSQSACSSVAPPNATTESPNHVHSKKNFAGESFRGDERKVWPRLRALALVAAMREASATNLQGDSHGLRPRSIRVGMPRYSQARWRTPGARAGASEARAAALQPGLRRDLLRRKCTARTEGALRGSRSRLSDSCPYQRQGARLAAARPRGLLGDLRAG